MKRITGLKEAYTPMTQEQQNVCEKGLKRIASGNTEHEDIRHFAGAPQNCKRWKPDMEIVYSMYQAPRIVYVEYEDRIHVLHMDAKGDDTYDMAMLKMRRYFAGKR